MLKEAAETVATLKRFYQKTEKKESIDINELLNDNVSLCETQYGAKVDFVFEKSEMPTVDCNPGDINQVISNIITNAAHAIEDKSSDEKGQIIVKTS